MKKPEFRINDLVATIRDFLYCLDSIDSIEPYFSIIPQDEIFCVKGIVSSKIEAKYELQNLQTGKFYVIPEKFLLPLK